MTQQLFITGSNRGVGLAFVKEFLSRGDVHIFATCRKPQSATDLQTLQHDNPDALTIIQLDVNNNDDIQNMVTQVSARTSHLDLLINNAGIYPKNPPNISYGNLESAALSQVMTTNSIAPVIVTQALTPLLQNAANPKVLMVSSQMGSIARAGASGFSYRMSKAALNMATKILSLTLSDITVITTHPGWVSTDMGGSSAPVTPAQSAAGLAAVITDAKKSDSGKFFNYTGEEIPW